MISLPVFGGPLHTAPMAQTKAARDAFGPDMEIILYHTLISASLSALPVPLTLFLK